MSKRTNGEGTIYQRANGLWCAELTIGYDAKGKRIKKNFSSMDLEKLQKKLNDEKYKLNRNIITQSCDYTVTEWVELWLVNYKSITLKSTTYDNYEYALNCHIRDSVGHVKLNKLRPEMIQQLFNGMIKKGLSTSTIKKVYITLNQAFEQAIKNELIYGNPCNAVTVPKLEKRKAVALTEGEQESFINNCSDSTYGNFFVFALNTGMRAGEITALTWKDVDFTNRLINVDKTASTVKNRDSNAETKNKIIIGSTKTGRGNRSIPISKQADQILTAQKNNASNAVFVFSSKTGTILMERNINRAFHSILKKANLPEGITVHTLRHTFATRLIAKGANPKVISELMGHSSIQITYDVYGHVMPNQKRDAIDLLD